MNMTVRVIFFARRKAFGELVKGFVAVVIFAGVVGLRASQKQPAICGDYRHLADAMQHAFIVDAMSNGEGTEQGPPEAQRVVDGQDDSATESEPETASRHPRGGENETDRSWSFRCSRCRYSCDHLTRIREHILRRHIGKKFITCPFCQEKFITPEERSRHVLADHGGHIRNYAHYQTFKQQERVEIDHVLNLPCSLWSDVRRPRTGQKARKRRYACMLDPHACRGKFSTLGHAREHVMRHLGKRVFQCPRCSLYFYCPGDRNGHLRRTHGENISMYPTNGEAALIDELVKPDMIRLLEQSSE